MEPGCLDLPPPGNKETGGRENNEGLDKRSKKKRENKQKNFKLSGRKKRAPEKSCKKSLKQKGKIRNDRRHSSCQTKAPTKGRGQPFSFPCTGVSQRGLFESGDQRSKKKKKIVPPHKQKKKGKV